MNVDSCNHICTHDPPEMKTTIDELTERATEKEAGMVRQVVHCHMYVQYICMYVLGSHIRTVYVHTVCSMYWLLHVLRAVLRLLLETRGREAPEGECSKQSNTAWRACSK